MHRFRSLPLDIDRHDHLGGFPDGYSILHPSEVLEVGLHEIPQKISSLMKEAKHDVHDIRR